MVISTSNSFSANASRGPSSRASGEVKHGEDLLAGDRRVELEKIVDRFAALEQVDEALNRHA